jgi:hypothetical protein
MLNIARALISAAAFLELSEDDAVDPDAAVKALEGIASFLQNATAGEVEVLRGALQAEREECVKMGWQSKVDFLDNFFAAFGVAHDESR